MCDLEVAGWSVFTPCVKNVGQLEQHSRTLIFSSHVTCWVFSLYSVHVMPFWVYIVHGVNGHDARRLRDCRNRGDREVS